MLASCYFWRYFWDKAYLDHLLVFPKYTRPYFFGLCKRIYSFWNVFSVAWRQRLLSKGTRQACSKKQIGILDPLCVFISTDLNSSDF